MSAAMITHLKFRFSGLSCNPFNLLTRHFSSAQGQELSANVEFREHVRDFAAKAIAPHAEEIDR